MPVEHAQCVLNVLIICLDLLKINHELINYPKDKQTLIKGKKKRKAEQMRNINVF